MPSRRGVVSSSVSIPMMTWPFSRRSANRAWRPCGRIPRSVAEGHHEPRHSSTDRSTGWCSSQAASPVNDSRITWQGTPATSACPWPRNRGGSARPARTEQLFGQRPGHVDRGEGHRPVHDVDPKPPLVDPVADPHLGVGGTAGRERQHEPVLGFAQDHPVVHDMAALVEEERVARATGLDVAHVARIEPLQEPDHIRPGDDQLAERADVPNRDRLANRPVLGQGVAVVPRSPPTPEAVHPSPKGEMLVMQGRSAKGVDVGVRRGLRKGDLARRRSGGERVGDASRFERRSTSERAAGTPRPGRSRSRPGSRASAAPAP